MKDRRPAKYADIDDDGTAHEDAAVRANGHALAGKHEKATIKREAHSI